MQLLILLVVNLLLLSIFYLVVSLKLEKSASRFHEKKLRNEMDAIIKEFNETAERNISLLENRITVLKKLVNISGEVKGIDTVVAEELEYSGGENTGPEKTDGQNPPMPGNDALDDNTELMNKREAGTSKGISLVTGLFSQLKQVFGTVKAEETGHVINHGIEERSFKTHIEKGKNFNVLIEKEFDKRNFDLVEQQAALQNEYDGGFQYGNGDENFGKEATGLTMSESDIELLKNSSDDKYKIISLLYKKGYQVEDIAHYSGIPAGEVKLVLNLTNSL